MEISTMKNASISRKASTKVKRLRSVRSIFKIIIIVTVALLVLLTSTSTAYAEQSNTDEITSSENEQGIEQGCQEHSVNQLDLIGFSQVNLGLVLDEYEIEMATDGYYRMKHNDNTIELMLDDLTGTPHYAYNTSVYSSRNIKESAFTTAYTYEKVELEGYPAHIYSFSRESLEYAPDLNTEFLYIEVEVEPQVLLSLHIASKLPIDKKLWMNRLVFNDGENEIQKIEASSIIEMQSADFAHEKTALYYDTTFENNESVSWGIFDPSTHYMLDDVENIETETGIQLDIILEYYDLGYLPRLEMMQMIADSGRVLELTYQTSKYGAFNADYLYEVLSGVHDESIDELISRIMMLDEPVLFRPNNEMNGDWCGYNGMYTHKDTAVYRTFWRWLHDRFDQAGAENVIWVWNPNWGDFPSAQWNSYLNYFPGEAYVDVIGLTGYNTGTYYPDETWRSFDEIYLPMLWEYNRHFSDFPYMITEFGSSATGGDKGAWIASALEMVEKMNIKAAVWWNHVDYDKSRGAISRGYKFDNDRDMLSVFRRNFKGE